MPSDGCTFQKCSALLNLIINKCYKVCVHSILRHKNNNNKTNKKEPEEERKKRQ